MTDEPAHSERHASWLELFFDLIAVAGVAQLAGLLHEGLRPSLLGLYGVLFLAFWTAWMCFTMYGNVQGQRARVRPILFGMFGLAVMAAAVPGVREHHAPAFALAYVLVRTVASRAWQRTGQVLVDWPVAQLGLGVTPWLVSVWCDSPLRYWLWFLGITLDLWFTLASSGQQMMASFEQRWQRAATRFSRGNRGSGDHARGDHPGEEAAARDGGLDADAGSAGNAADAADADAAGNAGNAGAAGREGLPRRSGREIGPKPVAAHTDPAHLDERMGLFTLIVIGESIADSVASASHVPWDAHLYAVAIGGFVLLLSVWSLALRYGSLGVPLLRPDVLEARFSLPLHCFATGTLAALSAALGASMEHADATLPGEMRWLLCGGTAFYLALAALAGAASGRAGTAPGARNRWLLRAAAPCVLLPLLLAVAAVHWPPAALVWLLVLALQGNVLYLERTGVTVPTLV